MSTVDKNTFTPEQVLSWRDGAAGFFRWIGDVQPRVPAKQGGFIIFEPEVFQKKAVREALAQNAEGNWRYGTLIFSFPRRHSKTTLAALLVLWRFFTRVTENIVILANSEKQSVSTGFAICKKIVQNTPALAAQLPADCIQNYRLEYPRLQNTIRTVSTTVSSLYGEKLTCGWISELHAAASDEGMQVLASSLGDSKNSWLIVDSTVDAIGGPLHRLEQLAESGEDPTICVHRLEYRDLEEALEKSPSWIRREWLKSRAAQLLPAVFASQHLNKRSEASNCLFAVADIQACKERLPHPLPQAELERIAGGRNYATGGGLDRAYFASLHGDSTIWTSVAKVADEDDGEPHFYVLHQKDILGSLATGIKKAILADVEQYALQNAVIEAYNAQDIATWATDKAIPNEIIHATNTAQVPAFTELHRVVKEHRLHFPDTLKDLARELETFLYELTNGQPRFGSKKFRDDRVYSLAWAVYSLRQKELAVYELENIVCASSSSHAPLCYLRGGTAILHCSGSCPSHVRVNAMFQQFSSRNVESDLLLQDFYKNRVTVSGARIHV